MSLEAYAPAFLVSLIALSGLAAEVAAGGDETRIAVWGFSADAGDAEGTSLGERLAALTEVELAGRGCAVVERRRFERILEEHRLGFTQFADARTAARAGELVRANLVLVGTVLKRREGRLVTMKAVETASGKVLDARVRALSESGLRKCASDAADFITAARGRKLAERVFLAVGGFEDLSVNDRFRGLGRELRGALAVAFRDDPHITVVEREHVEPLLLELGLSKSGLASSDFGETDAVPAFLVVDGLYQSYRAQETGVTLNLRFQRVDRRHVWVEQVEAKPGPPLFEKAASAIRGFIEKDEARERKRAKARAVMEEKAREIGLRRSGGRRIMRGLEQETRAEGPTPEKAEAEIHFKRGCEQSTLRDWERNHPAVVGTPGGRRRGWYHRAPEPARLANVRNAISSFESVLLLDPQHHRARILLAVCLADPWIDEFKQARELLDQVIRTAPESRLREIARYQLGMTYVDVHWKNRRAKKTDAEKAALDADYRRAIEIWRQLLEDLESLRAKQWVLSRIEQFTRDLVGLGLAMEEDLLDVVKESADLTCRVQLERAERTGSLHCYSLRRPLTILRTSEAGGNEVCLASAGELAARYPRLSYVIMFQAAAELRRSMDTFEIAHEALESALRDPDRFAGLPYALTDLLPEAVAWYASVGMWKRAGELADVLIALAAKYVHESSACHAEYAAMRAICYEHTRQWEQAAELYERLGDAEVKLSWRNVFGESVLAKAALARCRRRLGIRTESVVPPNQPLGAPVVDLCERFGIAYHAAAVSSLAATEGVLWIGSKPKWVSPFMAERTPAPKKSRSKRAGLCWYEPAGRRLKEHVLSQASGARWITALAEREAVLYAGTFGAGLFEFDPATGRTRRWTTAEGLLSNYVTALGGLSGDRLYVGFGKRQAGGCGWIDLSSGKFTGLTPRLDPRKRKGLGGDPLSEDPYDQPPKRVVTGLTPGADGLLWLTVYGKGVQRFDPAGRKWETASYYRSFGEKQFRGRRGSLTDKRATLTCLAVGPRIVAVGAEVKDNGIHVGSVDIYDRSTDAWSHVRRSEGLPDASVYSLAVRGKTLWIGGRGYVAAYDLAAKKLRRVYTVPNQEKVEALCIDGRTLWVGAGDKVYRIDE